MDKPIFSVLCYNFNNYDFFRDLDENVINPNAEYVYITNDHSITSNTWTIKHIDFNQEIGTWENCYRIRFNPFNYVNSDICIRYDASMQLNTDLTPLVDMFNEGNYDAGVVIHPQRTTQIEEYLEWIRLGCLYGGFTNEEALVALRYMSKQGHDVLNYNGMYCAGFVIQRNDSFNNLWNKMNYAILKKIAMPWQKIARLDQTIFTFVLNNYFSEKKIMPITFDILNGKEITMYEHTTGSIRNVEIIAEPYLFNEKCSPVRILN